jgi:hypothetical protein
LFDIESKFQKFTSKKLKTKSKNGVGMLKFIDICIGPTLNINLAILATKLPT